MSYREKKIRKATRLIKCQVCGNILTDEFYCCENDPMGEEDLKNGRAQIDWQFTNARKHPNGDFYECQACGNYSRHLTVGFKLEV